ncbi:unnamed protein product [Effrenium voratum]|nr:unnamed protein product [Effrenium voratum]
MEAKHRKLESELQELRAGRPSSNLSVTREELEDLIRERVESQLLALGLGAEASRREASRRGAPLSAPAESSGPKAQVDRSNTLGPAVAGLMAAWGGQPQALQPLRDLRAQSAPALAASDFAEAVARVETTSVPLRLPAGAVPARQSPASEPEGVRGVPAEAEPEREDDGAQPAWPSATQELPSLAWPSAEAPNESFAEAEAWPSESKAQGGSSSWPSERETEAASSETWPEPVEEAEAKGFEAWGPSKDDALQAAPSSETWPDPVEEAKEGFEATWGPSKADDALQAASSETWPDPAQEAEEGAQQFEEVPEVCVACARDAAAAPLTEEGPYLRGGFASESYEEPLLSGDEPERCEGLLPSPRSAEEADCAGSARDADLPSPEVDCAACARDADYANYLPSPTEEVDCAACARDADYTNYLPSPTEEVRYAEPSGKEQGFEAESYAADGFGDEAWANASDDSAEEYKEAAATGCSIRSVPACSGSGASQQAESCADGFGDEAWPIASDVAAEGYEAKSFAANGFGDAAWPNASDDAADVYEEDAVETGRSTRSVPAESSRSRPSPEQVEAYAADGFGDAAWPNASDDAAEVYEEDSCHGTLHSISSSRK